MRTNLIFKRQTTVDGVTRTITRIVPVDISQIETGEGWLLSGHADYIETTEDVYVHRLAPDLKADKHTDCLEKSEDEKISKFESRVVGTAKLVRSKGVIKIVARRGKSTYNQTTPNSVCINDFTKNEFFKNCREVHGQGAGIFQFNPSDGRPYDYWNSIIDKEYQRQLAEYRKENSI